MHQQKKHRCKKEEIRKSLHAFVDCLANTYNETTQHFETDPEEIMEEFEDLLVNIDPKMNTRYEEF